jgi:hypothetical protein
MSEMIVVALRPILGHLSPAVVTRFRILLETVVWD